MGIVRAPHRGVAKAKGGKNGSRFHALGPAAHSVVSVLLRLKQEYEEFKSQTQHNTKDLLRWHICSPLFLLLSPQLLIFVAPFVCPLPVFCRDLVASSVDVRLQCCSAGIGTATRALEGLATVLCVSFQVPLGAIGIAALAAFMLLLGMHLHEVL
jgi:hypothetical protein